MRSNDELNGRFETEKYIVSHLDGIVDMLDGIRLYNGVFDDLEDGFLRKLAINLASVYAFVEYATSSVENGGDTP